ncbi:hypothetical protein [Ereboglobus luteus]|uniref:Uncharacterized protein n=1 Tax=Ereboglobus luteus TaxID=1796921 RepID=A0A2U8E2P6_9BACT|nr:hypothetical protein [Ereboglobus luteus]AWI09148.1 hypothetical protein CKA38_07760 [Ereboglobus luteus]
MTTPKQFTAMETRGADGASGRVFRSARASSSISQSDAQQKAAALAQAEANKAASGGAHAPHERERYPYGVRDLTEPVLKQLYADGSPIARITRNAYGASVLNANRVMFVDVDFEQQGRDPRTGQIVQSVGGTTQAEALSALADLLAARPDLAFRVYSTAAGLRYLCTSTLFDPESPESEAILTQLKSDARYVLLCRKQKCYRARLSPKPWRCFKKVPLSPGEQQASESRGFFSRLFFPVPRTKTLRNPSDFATCRHIETVGAEIKTMRPEIAEIVRVHDAMCEIETTKPLA